MAPSQSRQLLVWTTLPFAILLSYLWIKRKRAETQSDPKFIKQPLRVECKSVKEPPQQEQLSSPEKFVKKPFNRSPSGVETAPIDIIFPPDRKSAKASQLVISDEDLDLEIEKIKSMKNSLEPLNKKKVIEASVRVEKAPADEVPKNDKEIGVGRSDCGSLKSAGSKKKSMAQKEIVDPGAVEEKLSSLKIGSIKSPAKRSKSTDGASVSAHDRDELQRQSSERDSANHSPADVMLASPSLSSISDNHSEGSSDSGKGGSDVATPPSRTPAGDGSVADDVSLPSIYEFVIPQNLVGKLIGRHGCSVMQIKDKTRAHILIKKHPESSKFKICAVEGTQAEIEHALEMIRKKFPEKQYPELTLDQVSFLPLVSTVPLIPEQLCLKLIEGINNDTMVSCMVAPNHLFLQQPTHPTYPNLNMLSTCMNLCYTDSTSPCLPVHIPENTVCVAQSLGAWYRAIVLTTDTETEVSYVKFLDYGGYASIPNADLKQIRADFLLLPFQASECFLANIRPLGGDDTSWTEEAYTLVADLTRGAIIYTQVAEYTEDGTPLVLIYVVIGPQQVIFLNEELVNRGYAEWTSADEENSEGAVGGLAT